MLPIQSGDHSQIGIVAHTSRTQQWERLADDTDASYVSVDDGSQGCDVNHANVWNWHRDHNRTPWAVTLEDDALPVNAFREQLAGALAYAPAPIVSLYLGRMRPPQHQYAIKCALHEAALMGACYLLGHQLFHAVGVAIRTDLLVSMTLRLNTRLPIDEAIGQWARQQQHSIAYTVPSLVNHSDAPSIIKCHRDGTTRKPGRTAWRAGPREQWTSDTVQL